MISRPYFVRNKSFLAILNSDFGRISLSKTVIALCRASFTSRYKVFITIAGQSRVSVIPYQEVHFDWFSKNTQVLEQSYTLQGYMLLVIVSLAECQKAKILPTRWNFVLSVSLKTIKTSSGQMRQLYAYVVHESTRRLVEDGMRGGE